MNIFHPPVIRVLFVCLGNICRSPMAEGIFRNLVNTAGLSDRFVISSAGTGGWHAGETPHPQTIEVLQRNQIDLGGKRAKQLSRLDIEEYDYVVAMDAKNVNDIQALFGRRVPRLLEFVSQEFSDRANLDVPDPYYTGEFDKVYQLIVAGSRGLFVYICKKENIE